MKTDTTAQQNWLNAVNNGSTSLCQLFSGHDVIAEVRCLNNHKLEVLDAWDNYERVKAERDELATALRSVIEWTGDDHDKPRRRGLTIIDPNGWFDRRLLMIRNAARAALAKLEAK